MKKIVKFLLSFFALILISSTSVSAEAEAGNENFAIDLNSSYTVNAAGKTIVEQKFTITNKTPEYFISRYGVVLSSTNLENIQVTSNGESIEPQISKQKGQTSIGVSFPDQIVGEGKKRELTIKYTDADISQISGKILEVNIPQLSDHYQYQNYQLKLIVPNIFGTPSRINPTNFTLQEGSDYNTITYNDLQGNAVSAIFGDKQIFDLQINYYLENPTSQNALTQITLPPETPFQRIFYHNLEPLPKEIKEDQDGNFIATYEIPANNSLNVELFAQVLLTLSSNPAIDFSPVLDAHTLAQKYWETNNPEIIAAANELNSIEEIYDYSIEKLDYTEKSQDLYFERLGAANAIKEENLDEATCQEFTDLFIAIAREKGVPARRVLGYAYSNNEELRPVKLERDILHTWPEYYNAETQSWIQIDPTWGDTTGGVDYFNKFDLNHLILAINGASSSMPYPAGSYSANEEEKQKKIFVDFSTEEFPITNPNLEISLTDKRISKFSLPGAYQVEIHNPSGQVWYFKDISLNSEKFKIKRNNTDEAIRIPPFAKIVLPITIYNSDAIFGEKGQIQVRVQLKDGQTFTNEFEVISSTSIEIKDPEKIIALGGGLVVTTLITGSLLLLGRKWANSLRRKGQKLEEESLNLQEISKTLGENQKDDQPRKKLKVRSSRKRTRSSTD
jgi:transglutaminase-like putative cysteine protease